MKRKSIILLRWLLVHDADRFRLRATSLKKKTKQLDPFGSHNER